jgi:hypothetical protein
LYSGKGPSPKTVTELYNTLNHVTSCGNIHENDSWPHLRNADVSQRYVWSISHINRLDLKHKNLISFLSAVGGWVSERGWRIKLSVCSCRLVSYLARSVLLEDARLSDMMERLSWGVCQKRPADTSLRTRVTFIIIIIIIIIIITTRRM